MATSLDELNVQQNLIKLTVLELVQKLSKSESIVLKTGESLKIVDLDMNDFLAIANETDNHKKLNGLQLIMNRFKLQLFLEGSMTLGAMNLDDHSWTLTAGDSGQLRISAKLFPLRLSLTDLITFLKRLPLGQALVLKEEQELLLEGFSPEALSSFFNFCQNTTDIKVLEKAQDDFFVSASLSLAQEGLDLKLYALNATMMNREVNPIHGQILFKPVSNEEKAACRMMAVLIKRA